MWWRALCNAYGDKWGHERGALSHRPIDSHRARARTRCSSLNPAAPIPMMCIYEWHAFYSFMWWHFLVCAKRIKSFFSSLMQTKQMFHIHNWMVMSPSRPDELETVKKEKKMATLLVLSYFNHFAWFNGCDRQTATLFCPATQVNQCTVAHSVTQFLGNLWSLGDQHEINDVLFIARLLIVW